MDIPTVSVSTLRAMAARAQREHEFNCVLAVLDARRDEVYWAAFVDGIALTPERANPAAEVVLPSPGEWWICGPECDPGAFSQAVREGIAGVKAGLFPAAWDVAMLGAIAFENGETQPPHEIEPVYLSGRSGWKKLSSPPGHD